jgi:DNA-directed RNA polymerase specialized sigma24 family protein
LRTITERKIFDRARNVARVASVEGGSDAHDRWLQLAEQCSDSTLAPKKPTPEQLRLQQAMLQVREEVGERKWLLFCAVLLDGLTTEEAAAQFEVTPNVVYLAKSRTLRRLREVLNEGAS